MERDLKDLNTTTDSTLNISVQNVLFEIDGYIATLQQNGKISMPIFDVLQRIDKKFLNSGYKPGFHWSP